MKKHLLLVLIAFLLFGEAKSQVLLSEGFESTFVPTGWTRINASTSTGRDWLASDDVGLTDGPYAAHAGTKCMVYEYDITGAANAWMITPAVAVTSGLNYKISFWYRVTSATYPEKLKITLGNAATVAAQTTTLWDNNGGASLSNTTYAQASINYTALATGNVYFGFNCYSIANEWGMQVDDIVVEAINPCSGTPVAGTAVAATPYLCASGTTVLNLSGASSSTGLTYQWQSSPVGTNTWTNIPSATTVPYTATVAASADYRCIVTCSNGGASSNSGSTSVTLGAVPANDDVCNAITLALNGSSHCGNTTCATSVADPAFTSSTPNNTTWYKFTPATTGLINIVMTRPAGITSGLLNAWVGIYTATGTCPTLTLTQVTPATTGYDLTSSSSVTVATPSLTAGTTYYFMVDGNSSAVGAYCIQIITPPTPPTCTTNISPANAATNVDYLSLPGVKLKWNTASGATGYDLYWGTVNPPTTLLGSTPADSVIVTGVAASTTYYWYIAPKNNGGPASGCSSSITSFTTAAAPAPPANDDCTGAVTVSQYVGPTNYSTVSATQSLAPSLCGGFTSTGAGDIWFKFTTSQAGSVTITTTGLDVVIEGFSGTCGSLTSLGCADVSGTTEILTLTGLAASQTYYFRVYGYGTVAAGQGSFALSVSGAALPVGIANFRGERNGNINALSWSTTTETNNAGFELQRSADGINFSTLSFIASKATNGSSNQVLTYSFNDVRPFAGNGYYRLKQIDKDGKSTISEIVLIKGVKSTKLQLISVYPNPVINAVHVGIASPKVDNVTIIVSDITGKVIISKVVNVIIGDNNLQLDLSTLAKGSYTLKVVCADGCETAIRKFVKE